MFNFEIYIKKEKKFSSCRLSRWKYGRLL